MKKSTLVIAGILLLAVTYLFLWKFYPKNTGIIYGLGMLYVLDFYLYWVYRKNIWSGSKLKGIVISLLYWMPLLMILLMALVSLAYPFDDWSPNLKTWFSGIIFTGYVSKLFPVALILLSDISVVIRKLLRKRVRVKKGMVAPITRGEFIKKAGLATGGLFLGTLTLGMFKWVYDFNIIQKNVYFPDLPPEFEGFRIIQLSDIHLGSWLSKNELEVAIDNVLRLYPDVIVFTGDLVNYSTDEAYRFKEILGRLSAPNGIYAILGNHDYGDYKRWPSAADKEKNMEELFDFYQRLGWKLLRNENAILRRGNSGIALLGVENWGSLKRFQRYGDLEKAFLGTEAMPVRILLSHDPSHWEKKVLHSPHHVHLTLSGHTHGAQFGIEVPGMRWSPSQYVYKYWAGLYSEKNAIHGQVQHLYVNRGLGAIGYPGRVGILPEITLISLTAKET